VKWRNCPSAILLSEEDFFQKISGKSLSRNFPEEPSFGRSICDFRKYSETTSGRTSSGMFLEEASSGRFPFSSGNLFFLK